MKVAIISILLFLTSCTTPVVPDKFWHELNNTAFKPEPLPEWKIGQSCEDVLPEIANKYQRCALQSEAVRDKVTALKDIF